MSTSQKTVIKMIYLVLNYKLLSNMIMPFSIRITVPPESKSSGRKACYVHLRQCYSSEDGDFITPSSKLQTANSRLYMLVL